MVFISYSYRSEKAVSAVSRLCERLEQQGLEYWTAKGRVEGGEEFRAEIWDAINNCSTFVLMVTKEILSSKEIKRELNISFEKGKRIIPFMVEDIELTGNFGYISSGTHLINAFHDLSAGINELVRTLAHVEPEPLAAVAAAGESGAAVLPEKEEAERTAVQPEKPIAVQKPAPKERKTPQQQEIPPENKPKRNGRRAAIGLLLLALVCGVVFWSQRPQGEKLSLEEPPEATETSAVETAEPETDPEIGIHRYSLEADDCSWTEAFEKAKAAGGYLARINNEEEYAHILNLIQEDDREIVSWRIGARRDGTGDYCWVDENNVLYGKPLQGPDSWCSNAWRDGEPSYQSYFEDEYTKKKTLAEENCLQIHFFEMDGEKGLWLWNDIPDRYLDYAPYYAGGLGYIVEYE